MNEHGHHYPAHIATLALERPIPGPREAGSPHAPRRDWGPAMTSLAVDGNALARLVISIAEHQDQAAFVALFEHFAPRVKGFLMRQGADETEAEDLAQDVMLAVWRKAPQFDPAKAAVSTWIFTIARNRRIDVLRRERRPAPDPDDPVLTPEPEPSAETSLTSTQVQHRIRDAIAALPAEQAEVVALSFYEDLAHSDIAERLGIPLGTVKSRLRLAFRKVKAEIGDAFA